MSEKLYCTTCDREVWITHGHSGYVATCDCLKSFHLAPGSGDPPISWVTEDEITDHGAFTIPFTSWSKDEKEYVGGEAVCKTCESSEYVSVSFEAVSMDDYDIKATLECPRHNGYGKHKTTIYAKSFDHRLHDFWPDPEELTGGDD